MCKNKSLRKFKAFLKIQQEVLVFVELLLQKSVPEDTKAECRPNENQEWNRFSLDQAMIGLENDDLPEYTEAGLKEKWQSQ